MPPRIPSALVTLKFAGALLLLAGAAVLPLHADPVTIAQNVPATANSGVGKALPSSHNSSAMVGFSFTTGASGPYDDLTLNLFSNSASTAAYAVGTGFLFSQAYTGNPGLLTSSTSGYLGSVAASGNEYTFAPSLTLQPNTTYYFYQNGTFDTSLFSSAVSGQTNYAAGVTAGLTPYSSFSVANTQMTFRLTGDVAPVPEPATWAALAGALALAGAWTAKRAKQRTA